MSRGLCTADRLFQALERELEAPGAKPQISVPLVEDFATTRQRHVVFGTLHGRQHHHIGFVVIDGLHGFGCRAHTIDLADSGAPRFVASH